MLQLRAFRPLVPNNTVVVTTSTGSQTVTLSTSQKFGTCSIRVVNLGTDTTLLEFGNAGSTPSANATSMIMLGNTVEVFTLTQSTYAIAFAGSAGGNTLYITPGEGL